MRILRKPPRGLGLNEPLKHPDHRKPVTRRDFLSAGMIGGSATVLVPGLLGSLMTPSARANVLADLDAAGLNASLSAQQAPPGDLALLSVPRGGMPVMD